MCYTNNLLCFEYLWKAYKVQNWVMDPKLPSPKGKNYESYALKTKLKLDYIDLKWLTKWREEEDIVKLCLGEAMKGSGVT